MGKRINYSKNLELSFEIYKNSSLDFEKEFELLKRLKKKTSSFYVNCKIKIYKMQIIPPFNLSEWIANNRHLLKPPVGNKNLYVESGDYIVMIVAGPNARKDYHYNETEELFYQIEGDIIVKTQQEGKLVEYKIKENEMFLLPANTFSQ